MIELRRTRSQLSLSPTVWMLTIELARVCGWTPEGTHHDTVGGGCSDSLADFRHLVGWQTGYVSNEGQTVTAPDAAHLADALNKAAVDGERILTDWAEGRAAPPPDVRTNAGGFRWFSTLAGKDHLQTLANFCRGGAFQIF